MEVFLLRSLLMTVQVLQKLSGIAIPVLRNNSRGPNEMMSRYMDIINGKTGYLADARRKWKRRLRKYKV